MGRRPDTTIKVTGSRFMQQKPGQQHHPVAAAKSTIAARATVTAALSRFVAKVAAHVHVPHLPHIHLPHVHLPVSLPGKIWRKITHHEEPPPVHNCTPAQNEVEPMPLKARFNKPSGPKV